MTIKVSKTKDDNIVVEKTLDGEKTLNNCEMVNTDILNPILKLSSDYASYNYCHIPSFRRYYFVNEVEAIPGGHCLLHCHVDVLMTWGAELLNTTQMIHRNEFDWNKDIVDNKIPLTCKVKAIGREFNPAFTGATFINKKYILGLA